MEEHDRLADEAEQELDRMEEESERLKDEIDDTREDWESKKGSESVPGAQPEPESDDA
jgi:hypothetical protein